MKESDSDRYCPKCSFDFLGDPIPEKDQHLFGFTTHFDNRIAYYDMELDRTISTVCPECFSVLSGKISQEELERFKERWKNREKEIN